MLLCFSTLSADAGFELNSLGRSTEMLVADENRFVSIPEAASYEQLKALQRQRHSAGLIESAKQSCRSSLQRKGTIGFAEAQKELLQSCVLMNTLLDQMQRQPTVKRAMLERTTITCHQLRCLIQDLLQYNGSST